ncbi:MAG: DUF3710 domain-containing protein [Candidatus Phosphoribacter sp.]|nr:DUF3710 domain-containing protein [Actinomycetales bacterium]
MGLFGRKRDLPDPAEDAEAAAAAGAHAPYGSEDAPDGAADDDVSEAPVSRLRGPFDRSEVTDVGNYLDLGALMIAQVDGLVLALEMDEAAGKPVSVQLQLGASAAQLQAYAAPRTEGIWPEIRVEIVEAVVADGGLADAADGAFGKELHVHPRGGAPMRFIGIDGPRWFLRAVLSGPAAVNDAAAAPLIEAIRATVVVRGAEAMPPRELLPLVVPQLEQAEPETSPAVDEPQSADDLRPFARGPEITEVH